MAKLPRDSLRFWDPESCLSKLTQHRMTSGYQQHKFCVNVGNVLFQPVTSLSDSLAIVSVGRFSSEAKDCLSQTETEILLESRLS